MFRLFLDFFPLAVFFVAFKTAGLMAATAGLMACTLVVLGITYYRERKIALNPLISGIVVTVFGGLTLALQDDAFIKMKPTLVNLLFAAILIGGLTLKKPLLKPLLDSALQLTDRGWTLLSLRWALFFIFLAGLNEVIWRNFPLDFWVNFKVFGMLPLTIIFMACQYPLLTRHHLAPEETPSEKN